MARKNRARRRAWARRRRGPTRRATTPIQGARRGSRRCTTRSRGRRSRPVPRSPPRPACGSSAAARRRRRRRPLPRPPAWAAAASSSSAAAAAPAPDAPPAPLFLAHAQALEDIAPLLAPDPRWASARRSVAARRPDADAVDARSVSSTSLSASDTSKVRARGCGARGSKWGVGGLRGTVGGVARFLSFSFSVSVSCPCPRALWSGLWRVRAVLFVCKMLA